MDHTCEDCGRITTCWCGRCHYCEDVTVDPDVGPLDEGEGD